MFKRLTTEPIRASERTLNEYTQADAVQCVTFFLSLIIKDGQ